MPYENFYQQCCVGTRANMKPLRILRLMHFVLCFFSVLKFLKKLKYHMFMISRPTTLDAFVFGFLAPLYKVQFPKVQLQDHLKQLPNLCRFCDDILSCYFRLNITGNPCFSFWIRAIVSLSKGYAKIKLWYLTDKL